MCGTWKDNGMRCISHTSALDSILPFEYCISGVFISPMYLKNFQIQRTAQTSCSIPKSQNGNVYPNTQIHPPILPSLSTLLDSAHSRASTDRKWRHKLEHVGKSDTYFQFRFDWTLSQLDSTKQKHKCLPTLTLLKPKWSCCCCIIIMFTCGVYMRCQTHYSFWVIDCQY